MFEPGTGDLRVVELTDLNDDLLLPWLDLFETAFPPTEKVLVSDNLRILKAKAASEVENQQLLAAVSESGEFLGMARLERDPECGVAWLWYLAMVKSRRSQGIGSRFYREILRRVNEPGCRAMLFEVEIPEEAHSEAERDLCCRRIGFYRRLGAGLLGGIHYMQSVGPHQPSIPMHIMLHPFEPMTAEEAFQLAQVVLGNSIQQRGSLTFEAGA